MSESAFESSVNSYGGKTDEISYKCLYKFESSVNSYGGKTGIAFLFPHLGLRVV